MTGDSGSVRNLNCAGLIVRDSFIANSCGEGILLDTDSDRNNRRYILVAVHVPPPSFCPGSLQHLLIWRKYGGKIFGGYNFPLFHMKYSHFSLSLFCSVTYISNESTQGGRNSVVGVVTRYILEVLGCESRLGRNYPYPSRPALGSTQPSVEWVADHFPGVKAARAWP